MTSWKETINDKAGLLFVSVREVEAFITQALKEEREAICEGFKELHHLSEGRSSTLECSQEGYEYGLEDAINLIKQRN